MASHELRTPLNSILGFSEILAAELFGPLGAPQYKEYAEIIRDSGQRLLNLVNQVMEIARLEARAIEWDLRPEPLGPVVEAVLTGFGEELEKHQVRITLSRGELPTVLADQRGLKAVLSGLIHNAIVFSPPGGEVRIEARRRGTRVEIEIVNPGEGVDPADLPRLLKPFEQGGNALTRRTGGAGLGLPICALTCEAMGGRLKLSSGEGQGLTARVRLPAA
jgi:signal transduction histidine kinase